MTMNTLANLTHQRRLVWLAVLVIASVAFSLGFACAVPLAAFATIAAATLRHRDALVFTGAVWLANQAAGFLVLGYPTDAVTLAWGVVLGASALAAVEAARFAFARVRGRASAIAAFVAAFAGYELTLFIAAHAGLGGTEDFTAGIVAYVLALNAVGAIALVLLNGFAARIGVLTTRDPVPAR
jgi:hypothetical protein